MDSDDAEIFDVVVNDEDQHSIWRSEQALPSGWRRAGFRGPKQECLSYIETHWTDMRPLSVRRAVDQQRS